MAGYRQFVDGDRVGRRGAKVTNAVQASNEMTVEAWVTPAAGNQSGPARIVTSTSSTPRHANFMLGQGAWGSLPNDTFASRFNATGIPAPPPCSPPPARPPPRSPTSR